MSRVLAITAFALFLMNCQSTPISEALDESDLIDQVSTNQPTNTCSSNNESEDCELVLSTIAYELPEVSCDPYEMVVDVSTNFFTPAGLEMGTTSRIDWEFLPEGNAGFWIVDLEDPFEANTTGSISMAGCFSFGDQSTLRITRSITDHDGNKSNELVIDIADPNPAKVIAGAKSEFEFLDSFVAIN